MYFKRGSRLMVANEPQTTCSKNFVLATTCRFGLSLAILPSENFRNLSTCRRKPLLEIESEREELHVACNMYDHYIKESDV